MKPPMQITDAVESDLVERLRRDVKAVHGDDHQQLIRDEADRVREFKREYDPACDAESYADKVVEDVQQRLMDEFIDTTWPACPRHGKHPLWYRDGSWWCEKDGVAVAPPGGLAGP